jgi:hypothetical protein
MAEATRRSTKDELRILSDHENGKVVNDRIYKIIHQICFDGDGALIINWFFFAKKVDLAPNCS